MLFILVKRTLVSTHEAHFAGGKHAFLCMAQELAREGHDVHVVTVSSRSQLLVSAVQGGRPACSLASLSAAAPPAAPHVAPAVRWREGVRTQLPEQQAQGEGEGGGGGRPTAGTAGELVYHAVLSDDPDQQQQQPSKQARVHAGVVHAIDLILTKRGSKPDLGGRAGSEAPGGDVAGRGAGGGCCWVVLDADDSQVEPPAVPAAGPASGLTGGSGSGSGSGGGSLFELIVARWQRQCIALVQNVHFLPFGPSGSGPRSPGLIRAWSQLGCVLCVSEFVRGYLMDWAPQGTLPPPPAAADQQPPGPAPVAAAAAASQQLPPSAPQLLVVPLSAWRCFGDPPFPDFGAAAVDRLQEPPKPKPDPEPCTGKGSDAGPGQLCIGVLKLSPEKGCSIVLELARKLPHRSFLAVAGDPRVAQAASGLPNLQVVDPATDIDSLLKRMSLVLAPSLWLEAWGMVVTEAMLRGLPTVVSNAGGLAEASLGVGLVIPVELMQLPLDPGSGVPDWSRRTYPRQQVDGWADAIERVLSDGAAYRRLATACRSAATAFVGSGAAHRRELLQALGSHLQIGA